MECSAPIFGTGCIARKKYDVNDIGHWLRRRVPLVGELHKCAPTQRDMPLPSVVDSHVSGEKCGEWFPSDDTGGQINGDDRLGC